MLRLDFTANRILFIDSNNHEYISEIINGNYSITLPNHQAFSVKIWLSDTAFGMPPLGGVEAEADMGTFLLDAYRLYYVKDFNVSSDKLPVTPP